MNDELVVDCHSLPKNVFLLDDLESVECHNRHAFQLIISYRWLFAELDLSSIHGIRVCLCVPVRVDLSRSLNLWSDF